MALLHACHAMGVTGVVAHCNFGLRGEESDRDEQGVRDACERLKMPLEVTRFDTQEYCRKHHISLEMGCRQLRYNWFRMLMKKHGAKRIATAHNADDADETMLLNLLRGTGIKGLTGMQPDNGEIVRPLIGIRRTEIVSYLREKGIHWFTDSTNLTSDVKRNFLRNEILPLLRTRWPGLEKALLRTRRHLSDTAAIAADALREYDTSEPICLILPKTVPQHFKRELIHKWLGDRALAPSQVEEMASGAPGAMWSVKGGCVEKNIVGLYFTPESEQASAPQLVIDHLPLTPEIWQEIRANKEEKAFYAPANIGFHMRKVKSDDSMRLRGGRARVSKILREAGLTPAARTDFFLMADRFDNPVWLPGIKRSALYTITDQPAIIRITLQ